MAAAAPRIEQSIRLRADPQRLFALLIDPNNIPQYAARIEAAEILEPGPDGGVVGSRLELGTASGNRLQATIQRYEAGRLLEFEDENGLSSTWTVEPQDDGQVLLKNTLTGPLTAERARRLRYDADVKFQAIAKLFEEGETQDAEGADGGHSRITGTARTPK